MCHGRETLGRQVTGTTLQVISTLGEASIPLAEYAYSGTNTPLITYGLPTAKLLKLIGDFIANGIWTQLTPKEKMALGFLVVFAAATVSVLAYEALSENKSIFTPLSAAACISFFGFASTIIETSARRYDIKTINEGSYLLPVNGRK